MNPRIQVIAQGVTSEVISLMTTLIYDPSSGGVQVVFGARPCVYAGDVYQGPGGDQQPLVVALDDIAGRCLGEGVDPVTGANLSEISSAGAVLIIKSAFAKLYDERVEALSAAPAINETNSSVPGQVEV
ncbi:hypothetical protein L2Y94_06695 [Luteibacter aegosomatis]|uniref:hypothetical protein n=1 Tax=Luteibacter aegosomatis TaxID=2911537 RepID=UPI001FFBF875|nr:hypothetical protein [Luteibacter aegosomatis]UPG87040.1 hypothetical protein L2Y94_06695 [Luteibacter aegosomatis]